MVPFQNGFKLEQDNPKKSCYARWSSRCYEKFFSEYRIVLNLNDSENSKKKKTFILLDSFHFNEVLALQKVWVKIKPGGKCERNVFGNLEKSVIHVCFL